MTGLLFKSHFESEAKAKFFFLLEKHPPHLHAVRKNAHREGPSHFPLDDQLHRRSHLPIITNHH
jgi:hypothetical protein